MTSSTDRFTFTVYRCPVCGRAFDDEVARGLTPMCGGRAGAGRFFDKASHEPTECQLLTVATVLDGDCPKCGGPMDEEAEESCAACAGGIT